jgi:ATP-dependent RNA helicase RhlE
VVVVDFPEGRGKWNRQDEEKKRLLDQHIKNALASTAEAKVLIFVNTKTFADELSNKLWEEGILSDAIHGGRPQEKRLESLDNFRRGTTKVLIATDVIGRGLDIPNVSHVVVYSMNGVADYIHRIGRTGRAGNEGEALSLVCIDEYKLLRDIEHLLKFNIPKKQIDGFLPDPSIKSKPEERVSKQKKRSKRNSNRNKPEANQEVWGRASRRSFLNSN